MQIHRVDMNANKRKGQIYWELKSKRKGYFKVFSQNCQKN